jgi:hypothetical protein
MTSRIVLYSRSNRLRELLAKPQPASPQENSSVAKSTPRATAAPGPGKSGAAATPTLARVRQGV